MSHSCGEHRRGNTCKNKTSETLRVMTPEGMQPVRGVVALGSKERSSKYLKMCACPNKMAKATGEKVFCKLRLDMPPQRRWFRIWSTISRWPHVTLIKNTFIPKMGALDFLTSFVGGLTKFVLLSGVSTMLQQ
jgi:hypothetical protein